MKQFLITLLLAISSFTTFGQVKSDTLLFNNIEIRVYTYTIESDTTIIAYFDRHALKSAKKDLSNFNKLIYDKTRLSIVNHVESVYPNAAVKTTVFKKAELPPFNKEVKPNSKSLITTDCYWIGAINYYSKRIRHDSTNYLDYFELANALSQYNPESFFSESDRLITLLNSCIQLNKEFEEAYLFKSRIHEILGIWKGVLVSDPHVDVVDLEEIRLAINCLNEFLTIRPESTEALVYRDELTERYGL